MYQVIYINFVLLSWFELPKFFLFLNPFGDFLKTIEIIKTCLISCEVSLIDSLFYYKYLVDCFKVLSDSLLCWNEKLNSKEYLLRYLYAFPQHLLEAQKLSYTTVFLKNMIALSLHNLKELLLCTVDPL